MFTNFACLLGNLITVDDYLKNEGWVKRIEGAFSRFDTNKDGRIVKFPKSYVDEIFKAIDTNENGKLERLELNDFEYKLWYGLDEEKGRNSLDSVLSNK